LAIVGYPIFFLVCPRLWYLCRRHHYITAGDFVCGRFGNRWLALAVAITGIVAMMPYIGVQLVGLQVVISALGISGTGFAADLPLIIAFVILAAFTYSSGLRAPASIAIVKDILIYLTAFAAVIAIPIELGGFSKIFAAAPSPKLLLPAPGPSTTGAYGAFATLALGSALAVFLYPHTLTGILRASSGSRCPPECRAAASVFVPARSARSPRLLCHRRPGRQPSRIRRRLQAVR
jgi:solute:Na+ symporter, SSS family